MGFDLSKKIPLGFGIVLLILVSLSVASYQSIIQFLENTAWVNHAHEVNAALESLLATATDIEAGQRGYILAGEESYLEPYRAALETIDQWLLLNQPPKV